MKSRYMSHEAVPKNGEKNITRSDRAGIARVAKIYDREVLTTAVMTTKNVFSSAESQPVIAYPGQSGSHRQRCGTLSRRHLWRNWLGDTLREHVADKIHASRR